MEGDERKFLSVKLKACLDFCTASGILKDIFAQVRAEDMLKVLAHALTDCKAELEHMNSPFLLQEVHVTKEKVLLFSDFLQLQL